MPDRHTMAGFPSDIVVVDLIGAQPITETIVKVMVNLSTSYCEDVTLVEVGTVTIGRSMLTDYVHVGMLYPNCIPIKVDMLRASS